MDPGELGRFAASLGHSLLTTLRRAHDKGVAHRDVRVVNVLLVPPAEEMAAVVAAGRDGAPEAMVGALRALTLPACGFMLNDWGNATLTRSLTAADREKRIAGDLNRLVQVLGQLTWVDDVFTIARKPEGPVALVPGERSFELPEDLREELTRAADARDYDALDTLIAAIRFVEAAPAHRR